MDSSRKLHAYIVTSMSEKVRNDKALELAAAMICEKGEDAPCRQCKHCKKAFSGIHPDIKTISREVDDAGKAKREIYVAQVREIISDAQIMPNEARGKVYIIRDGDTMNLNAQNAILKLLEEPPPSARFVLCGKNPGAFLETIRSRCGIISSNDDSEPPGKEALELAGEYIRLAGKGNPGTLLQFMAANEKLDTHTAREFAACLPIRAVEFLKGDSSIPPETIMRIIALGEMAEEYLKRNVGVKHVLGMLCVQDFTKRKEEKP